MLLNIYLLKHQNEKFANCSSCLLFKISNTKKLKSAGRWVWMGFLSIDGGSFSRSTKLRMCMLFGDGHERELELANGLRSFSLLCCRRFGFVSRSWFVLVHEKHLMPRLLAGWLAGSLLKIVSAKFPTAREEQRCWESVVNGWLHQAKLFCIFITKVQNGIC